MLQHHLHMKSLLTLLLLYTNHNLSTQPLWKNCSVCVYIYIYIYEYNIHTHTCIHTCWYKTYLLSNLNQATYTWASPLRKKRSSKLNIICPMALRNLVLASNTSLPIWNAVQFGPFWSNSVQLCSLWSNPVHFGPIWSSFNHFGQIRPISVLFGPIWSTRSISVHLDAFPSISVHFGPFFPYRSTLVYLVHFRSKSIQSNSKYYHFPHIL